MKSAGLSSTVSRADFIRGNVRGKNTDIRPPWSVEEHLFTDNCTRCGDCITACPEKILIMGRGQFPLVDFRSGECTFCQECATACKAGVFDLAAPAWSYRANISSQCIAMQGVVCRSCGESCGSQAIRFQLVVGGAANPVLTTTDCNGCGACMQACPVDAVSMYAEESL